MNPEEDKKKSDAAEAFWKSELEKAKAPKQSASIYTPTGPPGGGTGTILSTVNVQLPPDADTSKIITAAVRFSSGATASMPGTFTGMGIVTGFAVSGGLTASSPAPPKPVDKEGPKPY